MATRSKSAGGDAPWALTVVLSLVASLLLGCGAEPSQEAAVPTRVFASVVTHNEQDNNKGCRDLLSNEALFLENWSNTLAFARTIVDAGGAYDLQSDYRWIEELQKWETDAHRAETNDQNLFLYLVTAFPEQIAVDAHNHEKANGGPMGKGMNYADVAYLLKQLQVPDTGVVGGHLWHPSEDQDWTRFREPLDGLSYDHSWQPSVLWGAATKNHAGPDSEASGIWRPASAEDYHTDDPNQSLLVHGKYDAKFALTGGAGIRELVEQVRAGQHPEGVMLTVSVFFDQCGISDEDMQAVRALIESHQDDVDAGLLVWATVPETVRRWREEYGSRAYIANPTDPEASEDCGGCDAGKLCCMAPLGCAGKCVSDCRLDPKVCPQDMSCKMDGFCQ